MTDPTVLVPTSPIPSHPDTAYLERALTSIRAQLPDAPVVILADGVRPEQAHLDGAYCDYLEKVDRKLVDKYSADLYVAPEWGHQANLVRVGLELAETPTVLYVEHDCTIFGDIPWGSLTYAIEMDRARLIRLSPYEAWPDRLAHLMLDAAPSWVFAGSPDENPPGAVPRWWRTMEFSTWPHLASTEFYRSLLATYFAPECRTFLEPVLFAVIANEVQATAANWARWKLGVYAPDGDMKRCAHDRLARGDEPVFDFEFAYPGGVIPFGAPRPEIVAGAE